MATKTDDLKKTVQEIETYLKESGFNIFYGTETDEESNATEVQWNEEKSDWKGFLATAKKSGAEIIVLQASPFSEESLMEVLDEENGEGAKLTEFPKGLKENIGKIGRFSLFWFRDGVKYSYSEVTDWWKQVEELCSEELDISEDEKATIKEIETKPLEQLADELVTFMEKEFPQEKITEARMRVFWKSKGLDYSPFLDTSVENKMYKVRALAKRELEQKESRIIPEFIEDCLRWANDKGLKRISRANIDCLLKEKGLTLSKPSRETVYNKLKGLLDKRLKEKG